MSTRSLMLALTVSLVGITSASASPAAAPQTSGGHSGGGFQCANGVGVGCIGSIATLPITVNVKDVRVLDDNELTILSDDLNDLSILDGGILNDNTILNDVYATVLSDFLDKFGINVSGNKVGVCTSVLGLPVCL